MSPMPAASRIFVHATPAAPAPETTTRRSRERAAGDRGRVAQRGEHDDRGAVLVVVEHRDVDRRSRSRSSISKQRGAEMSSRLIPPNDGAIRSTVSTISSGVGGVEHDRDGVEAGELAEQRRLALHDRQRRGRADVAQPEHRGAVADDRDEPRAPGVAPGQRLVGGDRAADLGDARACRRGKASRGRSAASLLRTASLPPSCTRNTGPAKSGGSTCTALAPQSASIDGYPTLAGRSRARDTAPHVQSGVHPPSSLARPRRGLVSDPSHDAPAAAPGSGVHAATAARRDRRRRQRHDCDCRRLPPHCHFGATTRHRPGRHA